MAPFDRSHTTFYWSTIVNIALSCTVFELFDVEWYHDLEIWVKGPSRSFKMVLFESLCAVSYWPSIVTMALSCYCIVRAMHTRPAVKKCLLAISVTGGRGIRARLHYDFHARRRTGVARSDGRDGRLPWTPLHCFSCWVPRRDRRCGEAACMCRPTTIRSKYWSLRHWTQTVCLTPSVTMQRRVRQTKASSHLNQVTFSTDCVTNANLPQT